MSPWGRGQQQEVIVTKKLNTAFSENIIRTALECCDRETWPEEVAQMTQIAVCDIPSCLFPLLFLGFHLLDEWVPSPLPDLFKRHQTDLKDSKQCAETWRD